MSRKYEEGATYELSCVRLHETDSAVLILDPASGEELWIPLSQVSEMHFRNEKDPADPQRSRAVGTIVMTEWIAKKKGLL